MKLGLHIQPSAKKEGVAGLFAARDFAEGDRLAEFVGQWMTPTQLTLLEDEERVLIETSPRLLVPLFEVMDVDGNLISPICNGSAQCPAVYAVAGDSEVSNAWFVEVTHEDTVSVELQASTDIVDGAEIIFASTDGTNDRYLPARVVRHARQVEVIPAKRSYRKRVQQVCSCAYGIRCVARG